MAETENSIVYSSALIIQDPADLASLCVFYDSVILPHTASFHIMWSTTSEEKGVPSTVLQWNERYKNLFDSGCLQRLPKADLASHRRPDPHIARLYEMLCENLYLRRGAVSEPDPDLYWIDGLALSHHTLRRDIELPQLRKLPQSSRCREAVVAILAHTAASYLIPRLRDLDVDDILELRRRVADSREGFAFHLQKLSKGIDGKVKDGDSAEELARWARAIVETELIPDYREFRAQLQVGKDWLDPLGRVLEISSNPMTPKFYGDLLRAFGIKIPNAAEQVERRSNKSQAFQFMQAVEESKVAKYQRRGR